MRISNRHLAVDIAPVGAELQSIVTADGGQWLWQGDPQWWNGRSPLLFPVVGKSPANTVTIEGAAYPMQPHGFARRAVFAVAAEHHDRARLALKSSPETLKSFPFEFELSADYRLEGNTLVVTVEVGNLDTRDMPFGFGFHPAFNWPLPGDEGKQHVLKLAEQDEPRYLLLDTDGLLLPDAHASPFAKGVMTPEPRQFDRDALLFPEGVGSSISFGTEGGASVALAWTNLPNFGIWQKPGAPYLCLEPWHGMAARAGAGDAMTDRPGTVVLHPKATASFELKMTFGRAG
jgi:galactose mutarotase-like enzyme